ncbi:unnamed protein product, partial [Effrenium voratum]
AMANRLRRLDDMQGGSIRSRLDTWPSAFWKIGTGCSGTGSFEACFQVALDALLNAFEMESSEVDVAYAVECKAFKQRFLRLALPDDSCLFEDSLLLPDASSQVVTELQRLQEVRRSSGVTTGTHEKSQAWVRMHMSLAE